MRVSRIVFTLIALALFSRAFSQVPNIAWDATYGSLNFESLNHAIATSDGNYLLIGASNSGIGGEKSEANKGGNDFWIVKISPAGTIIWDRTIGGSGNDIPNHGVETQDGNYVIAGWSDSPLGGDKTGVSRGNTDYWIVKVDATTGDVIWDSTVGGSGFDQANVVVEATDGALYVAGFSDSNLSAEKDMDSKGGQDFWLVRLFSNGDWQWTRTIGGVANDVCESMTITDDGGLLLVGYSMSGIGWDKSEASFGLTDGWVVKTDALGNVVWDRTIGGSGSDGFSQVTQTLDGGYVVAGNSQSPVSGNLTQGTNGNSDFLVVRLSSLGTPQWQRMIGGTDADNLAGLHVYDDNRILLFGHSRSPISGDKTQGTVGITDYWAASLRANRTVEWDLTLGAPGGNNNSSALVVEPNGRLLFAGHSNANAGGDKSENARGGGADYWVLRLTQGPLPEEPDALSSVVLAGSTAGQSGSTDANGTDARFYGPQGIAYNPNIEAYIVADAFNHSIRRILSNNDVVLYAGSSGQAGFVDGPLLDARFNLPAGIFVNPANSIIYIADKGNHAIRVIDALGNVSTLAGSGAPGFADGTGSAALFNSPTGLFLHEGQLYVADHGNHAIRRIDVATGEVTTYLGNGTPGFADGVGTAARLRNPWGVMVTVGGVLLVTDYGNHCIRQVANLALGAVTTPAGLAGSPGFADRIGSLARFNRPTGICRAPLTSSEVIIADHTNRAIRKMNVFTFEVETLSGSNRIPGNQAGNRARYLSPVGVISQIGGSIAVVDAFSHQVRSIAP